MLQRAALRRLGVGFDRAVATAAISTTKLRSGLTLITKPLASTKNVATIGVCLKLGSRVENDRESGLTHFLEHMTFKGTQSKDRSEIEKFIENKGAHLNAYTTKENVAHDAPAMLNLIFDLILKSRFDEHAVEEEKHVILRESMEVERVHEEVLFDKIHEQVFPSSSLGRTILGSDEAICSVTKAKLHDFVKEHYTLNNMVVVAAGEFPSNKILAECLKLDCGEQKTVCSTPEESARVVASGTAVYFDQLKDIYASEPMLLVAHSAPGASWGDPRFFHTIVARNMLSSALGPVENSNRPSKGQRVRVPTNLAVAHTLDEYIFFDAYYKDCGLFGWYTACAVPKDLVDLWKQHGTSELLSNSRMQEIARHLIAELCGQRSREVAARVAGTIEQWTEHDLHQAKDGVLTMFAQAFDNSTTVWEESCRQFLTAHNGEISFAELQQMIKSITLEDVKGLISNAFTIPVHTDNQHAQKLLQHALTGLLRLPTQAENNL